MIDEYVPMITQVGFPIFVALYLILKTERVIKTNTEALTSIKIVMQSCKK